jgi:EpsI family protein
MRRRDLILGGLGVGALAASEVLRPRKRLLLLQRTTIDASVPRDFAGWESRSTSNLVGPEQAGRLARSLYSEVISRVYVDGETGREVMFLAAYGDTQSDLLQLHRPESCYPAVGYTIQMAKSAKLALPGGAFLPTRRVVATIREESENILYWTRMGETLPQTGGEQRKARLQNAVHGFVPDGILVRSSTVGDPQPSFAVLERFVTAMLEATPMNKRPALIGTELARRIV